MATYVKYQDFVQRLGEGVHQLHAAGHTLKVALTNTAPTVATDSVFTDITEISAGNGYTAGGEDAQNGYTETGGTGTLTAVDIVWTASGGTIGPFRYAVMYNSSTSPSYLIAYWDYGSSITLNNTETFTWDYDGTSVLTIA